MRLLICAVLLAGALTPGAAGACDAQTPCQTATGEYLARTPPGWDGRSPMPVVVFFHGYAGSAQSVMEDRDLERAVGDLGALLVAPQGRVENGAARSWSFPSKTFEGRDDFAFVADAMRDVERRWPVDHGRVLASGFSVGGSMVWYLACLAPQPFTAFAPVAGAFWAPEPETCPGGPVSLRHVHGTADQTVPMSGRSLRGGDRRQGDVLKGVAAWRRIDGCAAEPDRTTTEGRLACRTWSADRCASGRELNLCLHSGEHEIEAGWIVDAFHWMEGLPARAKGSAAR
ncbi:PHB depolymerase family esterase [Alsobacter sp. KACC 23698]|uniref:PHB depolymerase family esterase n=1 Tax=Alsobacter sp. KACC 23698 TaxID=3149229 RepID=A0AAU7JBS3_9HYPH